MQRYTRYFGYISGGLHMYYILFSHYHCTTMIVVWPQSVTISHTLYIRYTCTKCLRIRVKINKITWNNQRQSTTKKDIIEWYLQGHL